MLRISCLHETLNDKDIEKSTVHRTVTDVGEGGNDSTLCAGTRIDIQ